MLKNLGNNRNVLSFQVVYYNQNPLLEPNSVTGVGCGLAPLSAFIPTAEDLKVKSFIHQIGLQYSHNVSLV